MTNLIGLAIIAAAVVATGGGIVYAQLSNSSGEVRISAQRTDDGRVEFALQQRDSDGDWGDRILPARRYFPAEGFVNRWANSTPIPMTGPSEGAVYETCRAAAEAGERLIVSNKKGEEDTFGFDADKFEPFKNGKSKDTQRNGIHCDRSY